MNIRLLQRHRIVCLLASPLWMILLVGGCKSSSKSSRQSFFTGINRAADLGDVKAVKRYLAQGTFVDTLDMGITPLQNAVMSDSPEIVKILLDHGADPNGIGLDSCGLGQTPLTIAAQHFDCPVLKLLIEHGAKVNFPDYEGYAALVEIVRSKDSIPTMKLLLDNGADPNTVSPSGETALELALKYKNTEAAALLRSRGATLGNRKEGHQEKGR